MSIHLQPPVPLVTLVKTEPPTVIKDEPPVEALEEEISTDIKDIDIVYHPLSEDLIKSETVLEDILENKHLESVQTQALAKTENSSFIKTENITQRNKSEDTNDGNLSEGTAQGAVEVQASNEHSNALSNLETDEKSVLNFSKTLNGISVRSRKSKSPKKTDFAECYKTNDTTLWEKEKEKIKVIKAPMIPVEAHEYTSLAKDRHVCNHCQHARNTLSNLKLHIKRMHREVTTMYQCPYCPYKSKWSLQDHIIRKHKNTKDIQWFQCHLCEKKFKLKADLTRHKKVHLTHEQMKDRLGLREKRYHCDTCDYKTYTNSYLKNHKIIHLKPEEIEYFYCYHCSHKNKHKQDLKKHIFRQHFKNVKQEKRHHCDKCNYKTYASTALKNHKLTHLKPEEIQYFYCYHCSYKAKWKGPLKEHIFKHFKNEEIRFHCYICDFVRLKRDLIIEHIRKHFKNRNKYDETIRKYQLESRVNNLKKRCPNNLEDHCSTIHFDDHVNHIKKQKSEQPESTKSFISRTVSVPENSSKSCIFQCTYCPTKFPEEHLLKGHLQLHSSIKGIECPICTYKHNKTEILKHLSWHGANGDDSFKCPICDLKKRTKENMDDHLKVVHSKAIYQKHDSVCKNKTCNGFCQITIGGDVGAE